MAIITYPLNNIEYTAEDAELYHATRTSGVFANDDFPITVSGDGNVVTIGDGIGWIRNSKFSGKVVANKSEMSLDLGLPHATYPRVDAVVLQFNANANASEIIVKNGTAQTNPTPPEVVRTESVYELHLYHVYRTAGAASVTASNVTDLRSDAAYCGIMSDDVTMLGDDYVRKNMVGVANGVASLDSSGLVPETQIPTTYLKSSQLNSSVTSTSTTTPASSAAVKAAYDAANSVAFRTTVPTVTSNDATNCTVSEYFTVQAGKVVICTGCLGFTPQVNSTMLTFTFSGLPAGYGDTSPMLLNWVDSKYANQFPQNFVSGWNCIFKIQGQTAIINLNISSSDYELKGYRIKFCMIYAAA